MKKWLYPTAVERGYLRALQRQVLDPLERSVRENLLPVLPTIFAQARQDADIRDIPEGTGWFETLRQALVTTLVQAGIDDQAITAIVRVVANSVDEFNAAQFHAVLRSVYGVDILTGAPAQLQLALQAFEMENIQLIKSIPVESLGRMNQKIINALQTGKTLRDTQAMIVEEFGVAERRARLISRDQVGKLNGQLTEIRQKQIGVDSYTWRGVLDALERPEHVEREGKVFRWDNPPDDGHPGQPIQCFPGSVRAAFPHGYNKLWRHWYEGLLAAIVTADGVRLESTPNHPILTCQGWQALGAIQEGEHVWKAVRYGLDAVEIDVDQSEATFEEVFDFGQFLAPSFRARASEFDFHGDRPQQDVDVVNADRSLRDTAPAQDIEQFTFTEADIDLRLALLDSSRSRQLGSGGNCLAFGADCFIGFSRERLACLIAQIRHADQVGLRAGAQRQGGATQDTTDGAARNAEILRYLQGARSIRVTDHYLFFVKVGSSIVCGASSLAGGRIDASAAEVLAQCVRVAGEQCTHFLEGEALAYQPLRVIEVSRREFSGHVYNAATPRGWYCANGVVSHNCRCIAQPVLPSWEDLEQSVTGVAVPAGVYQ